MQKFSSNLSANQSSKRTKQLGFDILNTPSKKYFGCAHLNKSHAKTKRPITTKLPMHLVLRSSIAKGSLSFLKKDKLIYTVIASQAKRHGVRLYNYANGGNHIHLLVLPSSRQAFINFTRAISGLVARLILGAERGCAKGIKFWDQRPFSDIVNWGKHFNRVTSYLNQNVLEAYGFIAYSPRKIRFSNA